MLKVPIMGYQLLSGNMSYEKLQEGIEMFLTNYKKIENDPGIGYESCKEIAHVGDYLEREIKKFMKTNPELSEKLSMIEKMNDSIPIIIKNYKENRK